MNWCYRFLLPVLVLLSVEAKSQVYTYHPFPDSNIIWQGYTSCGMHGIGSTVDWAYAIKRDTTINGLLYHIIGSATWDMGCIREDSNKRVYFFNFSTFNLDPSSQERLLYDFSFSVGDTIFSRGIKLTVFRVDTPFYYGVNRRTIHLTDSVFWGFDTDRWIEGIGSYWGPLGTWKVYPEYCPGHYLCSAQDDTASIFRRDADIFSLQCSQFSSLEKVIGQKVLSIFPNPCTTTFTIQLTTPPVAVAHFQLYDALGRQVKREEINSTTTTIHRTNLPSGIYFWQLIERNKILERGKVVME
ncbi:MAG: T9SS type A sorting domain-containing protein [Bacteroidetes bacterium]|nr:T9SS type A sorting domain-containing protein [Bacteroidota bacterium]